LTIAWRICNGNAEKVSPADLSGCRYFVLFSRYNTPKISEEELNDFIKIWPEFKELNLMKTENVSYNTVSQEDLLDWKAGIWFLYHRWDAERFFYVRQRVLSALQAIEVRNTAYSFITMLQNKKDGLSAKMIELQKQRIGADEFEDDEIGLIQKNEKILRSIFE
jgi:hypothetical protein